MDAPQGIAPTTAAAAYDRGALCMVHRNTLNSKKLENSANKYGIRLNQAKCQQVVLLLNSKHFQLNKDFGLANRKIQNSMVFSNCPFFKNFRAICGNALACSCEAGKSEGLPMCLEV